jgi:hypothetical protein
MKHMQAPMGEFTYIRKVTYKKVAYICKLPVEQTAYLWKNPEEDECTDELQHVLII